MKKKGIVTGILSILCIIALCGCGGNKYAFEDTLMFGHKWGEKEDDFYLEKTDNYRVTKDGELFGYLVEGMDGNFNDDGKLDCLWYTITLADEENANDVMDKMFELLKDQTVLQHDEYETKEYVEWNTHDGPGGVTASKVKNGSLWEISISCWYR